VRLIPLQKLYCNIIYTGPDNSIKSKHKSVFDTPHYQCLKGDSTAYDEYYSQFRGKYLKDDHNKQKLISFAENFEYLKSPHEINYILTRYDPINERYIVLDGTHRSAIVAKQNIDPLLVAVINN
jgi:hypothetical protein